MKNIVIIVLIVILAWKFISDQNKIVSEPATVNQPIKINPVVKPKSKPKQQFECDGRQYCSQMSSCAEATYFIQHCPDPKMDGDSDGIPCERQLCQ
jgi:hypothetical protein